MNSPAPLAPANILTIKLKVILPPPGVFERPGIFSKRRWKKSPGHSKWVLGKVKKGIFVSTPVQTEMERQATKFWSWWCGSLEMRQWTKWMANGNNWGGHAWL